MGKGKRCSDSFPSSIAAAITDIDECKDAANAIEVPFLRSVDSAWNMLGCYVYIGYAWSHSESSDIKVYFNTHAESTSHSMSQSQLCQRGKTQNNFL